MGLLSIRVEYYMVDAVHHHTWCTGVRADALKGMQGNCQAHFILLREKCPYLSQRSVFPIVGVEFGGGGLERVSPFPVELDQAGVAVHLAVGFDPNRRFAL